MTFSDLLLFFSLCKYFFSDRASEIQYKIESKPVLTKKSFFNGGGTVVTNRVVINGVALFDSDSDSDSKKFSFFDSDSDSDSEKFLLSIPIPTPTPETNFFGLRLRLRRIPNFF